MHKDVDLIEEALAQGPVKSEKMKPLPEMPDIRNEEEKIIKMLAKQPERNWLGVSRSHKVEKALWG